MSLLSTISLRRLITIAMQLSVCVMLNSTAQAITIGDYQSIASDSLSIPLSQLDNAKYLDVTVDISGQPINYILEQINADLVLIKISDELLVNKDALITIKVDSPNGSASRLFSYSSNTALYEISDTQKAKQVLEEKQNTQIIGKVLIPATFPDQVEEEQQQEVKFEDGKLLIDINNSTVNVGIAVYELARANNYNVLVLPGDEHVFNSPLLDSVSQWNDLYLASDKAVRQIFFDEHRRLVRVVGENFLLGASETGLAELESPVSEDTQLQADLTVRDLVVDYAVIHNLELLELPGDSLILDRRVEDQTVTDAVTLASLARSVQAMIDIDENLGLIRVRN